MEAKLHIPGLDEVLSAAVEKVLADHLAKLSTSPYVDQCVAAEWLHLSVDSLLDRRNGHLDELEYSQQGKRYWFTRETLTEYVERRKVKRRKGRIPTSLKRVS